SSAPGGSCAIWRRWCPKSSSAGGKQTTMKIAIGSDHRGFEVKRRIASLLERLGHEVLDMGPSSSENADYPDYAFQVAKAVSERRGDCGILVCGTSIGMCIGANKVRWGRAAPCHDSITAEMSRRHN